MPLTKKRRFSLAHPSQPILALAGTLCLAVGVAVGLVVLWPGSSGPTAPPRAVIIDELSTVEPNPDFVGEVGSTLRTAGFLVDYVPSQAVTVDFYRSLPAGGYKVVIIRGHSYGTRTGTDTDGTPIRVWQSGLFTSEPYTLAAHASDQSKGLLDAATIDGHLEQYFGIPPDFVARAMHGNFHGATVILMGCQSLSSPSLAAAFAARGAGDIVGWDDRVTAQHSDEATTKLLRGIFVDNADPEAMVRLVSTAEGPDPVYGGRLRLYRQ